MKRVLCWIRETSPRCVVLSAILVLGILPDVARTAPPNLPQHAANASRTTRPTTGGAANGLENLWRMMARGRRTHMPSRNAPEVQIAFRDVVAPASASTVRVLCDGKQVALGTVVGADGYILSKSSEVKGSVTCLTSNGSVYPARVVNRDSATDLVMLRVSTKHLLPISWDSEDAIQRGRWVATVGLGDLPVAIGVVSTAPHRVRGGMLGIIPGEGFKGPLIQHVVHGSGADKAGLLIGDTITHINGDPVATPDELIARLATIPPNQKVRVTILRNAEKMDVTVTLGDVQRGDQRQAKLNEKLAGALSERRVGFASVFEHDTVVQPNQCGGPLVDVNGRAVGVNIARASRVSSFALPADVVRNLIPKLMREATAPVSSKVPDSTLLKPILPPPPPSVPNY